MSCVFDQRHLVDVTEGSCRRSVVREAKIVDENENMERIRRWSVGLDRVPIRTEVFLHRVEPKLDTASSKNVQSFIAKISRNPDTNILGFSLQPERLDSRRKSNTPFDKNGDLVGIVSPQDLPELWAPECPK